MLQAYSPRTFAHRFGKADRPMRQRIAKLRELAREVRRIAEEYAATDLALSKSLLQIVREFEEEAAALERDQTSWRLRREAESHYAGLAICGAQASSACL